MLDKFELIVCSVGNSNHCWAIPILVLKHIVFSLNVPQSGGIDFVIRSISPIELGHSKSMPQGGVFDSRELDDTIGELALDVAQKRMLQSGHFYDFRDIYPCSDHEKGD